MNPDETVVYLLMVDSPDNDGRDDSWWDYDTQQSLYTEVVGVFDSEGAARQASITGLGGTEVIRAYLIAMPLNRVVKGKLVGYL